MEYGSGSQPGQRGLPEVRPATAWLMDQVRACACVCVCVCKMAGNASSVTSLVQIMPDFRKTFDPATCKISENSLIQPRVRYLQYITLLISQ